VRFDLNDYSIPHRHVQRTLTVRATQDSVRILAAHEVITRHARSLDQAAQIENPLHIETLVSGSTGAGSAPVAANVLRSATTVQNFYRGTLQEDLYTDAEPRRELLGHGATDCSATVQNRRQVGLSDDVRQVRLIEPMLFHQEPQHRSGVASLNRKMSGVVRRY
jgi:hypothetical protein